MAARIEGAGTRSWAGPLITEEQRAEFDDRGFVLLEGALAPPLVDRLTQATERIWTEQLAKGLDHGASLHLKGFVTLDDAFLDLLPSGGGHPRMEHLPLPLPSRREPARGNGVDQQVGVAPRRRKDRSGPGDASRTDDVGEGGLLPDGRLGGRPGQPPRDPGQPPPGHGALAGGWRALPSGGNPRPRQTGDGGPVRPAALACPERKPLIADQKGAVPRLLLPMGSAQGGGLPSASGKPQPHPATAPGSEFRADGPLRAHPGRRASQKAIRGEGPSR